MRVLFICIHNSARSQMAEAFVRAESDGAIEVESAGLEAGRLNPLVVKAMAELGIDISHHQCTTVDEILKKGVVYTHVITVCDESSAERCPMFPGTSTRLHWSFADPSTLEGSDEEKLAAIRPIRDDIRQQVRAFLATL